MHEDAPPVAEATAVAIVGALLLVAGVVAGAWTAALVGLVAVVAGLTVRALAVFKGSA